jgi:S-adenosylhomocysteine hydrolase
MWKARPEQWSHLYLLGEGGLISLATAERHPASVMDMSLNQSLSLEYLVKTSAISPDIRS